MNKMLDKITGALSWIISQPLGRYSLAFIAGMALVLVVQCSVAGEVMVGYDLRFNDWSIEVCEEGACVGYDNADNLYYLAAQDLNDNIRGSAGVGYQPHTESVVIRVVGSLSDDESTGELWAKGLIFENYVEGAYGFGFRYIEDEDVAPVMSEPPEPTEPPHRHRRHHHEH